MPSLYLVGGVTLGFGEKMMPISARVFVIRSSVAVTMKEGEEIKNLRRLRHIILTVLNRPLVDRVASKCVIVLPKKLHSAC